MKLSVLFHFCARSLSVGAIFVSFFSFSQEPDTLQFYFDTDDHQSFSLSNADQKRLNSLYPETRILSIVGHCDKRGTEEYNIKLSQKRVDRVKKHLSEEGFDVSNSKNEALGESQALHSGLSLEKCRRVDVLFIEPAIKDETVEDIIELPPVPEHVPTKTPPPSVGLSKTAIEQFLEDEDAEELAFDLTILFVNVSTRVLDESKPQMFELLEIMQNNPSLHATFHGHVCCQPHPDLAEGRARAVAIFLREYGISADRLDFVGHSNNQPKVWPEVTDEDRKQNRRVAVVFTKSDE